MKFAHVSMVARDADRLANFYQRVFACEDLRPRKFLSGEKVSRGNGLPNCAIYSIWLSLPGVADPFLEILQYTSTHDRSKPVVNEPGYGYLSFEVENVGGQVLFRVFYVDDLVHETRPDPRTHMAASGIVFDAKN